MSTKTGIALWCRMASAVATNEKAGVMTSSPGPMPAAASAMCSAAVPLLVATAYLMPM